MRTDNSLGKSLGLVKIKGRRRRGCQRMRCLESIIDAMNMNLGKFWEMVRDRQGGLVCCSPWDHKEYDMTGQLKNNNNMYIKRRKCLLKFKVSYYYYFIYLWLCSGFL